MSDAKLTAIHELHQPIEMDYIHGTVETFCTECGQKWPCRTVAILGVGAESNPCSSSQGPFVIPEPEPSSFERIA